MTSSEKYCISVVPPLKTELKATPASTITLGVDSLIRESMSMAIVVIIPPANAQIDTAYGLEMLRAVLTWEPAPRNTIATAAPNDAPWETPSVDADASGFLRTFCIMHPHIERAVPTAMAAAIRGSLTFHNIEFICLEPCPDTVFRTSIAEISAEPAISETRQEARRKMTRPMSISHFIMTYC